MAVVLRRVAHWPLALAALIAFLAHPTPTVAQNVVGGEGLYITVPSPLTSDGYTRIKNRVEAARSRPERRPAAIIFDFNPNDKAAATPDFGPCYELADLIARLRDVTTIGYVPAPVSGHAVLPVLACQQIVTGPGAVLGNVVGPNEPPLTGYRANGYVDVVSRSHPEFVAVAKKMFDPAVQLRRGKKGGADWYLDLRERAKAAKEGVQVTDTAPLPAAPDGQIGSFTATQLRDLGLSRRTVDNKRELLEAFGLSPATLREDPLAGRPPVAFRTILRGEMTNGVRESVERTVKDIIRQKGNMLFLQLECAGGDLQAARDLAQKLREYETGEDGVLIVAFIPDRAPDSAAIVALGCSEIVMSKRKDAGPEAPEAEFGDFSAAIDKGTNVDFLAASLKDLAEAQGYPPILIDGMLKKDIGIVRVHNRANRAVRRLMSESEYTEEKQARGANFDWVLESTVKPRGQLLKLNATQAEELGVARFLTDTRDPAELYAKYGLEPGKVKEAAPAWLDRFAAFLRLPAVTVLLVVIGFTRPILELKVPGATIPGIIAALCFIMVFWAHTQFSGQVAVLAGLLFILGLVLVLTEVFVLPGFGVAGVVGIVLMLAALGLITFNEVPDTWQGVQSLAARMGQYLLALVVAMFGAFTIARYLPKIPGANRLMLMPPGEKTGEAEPSALPGAALAASLLGAVGTSVTVLRPAGTVRFGDQYIDVVTEGGFIPAGSRVQVIEVEGVRIVVKEV
jgi:membrane-bound ClpP family serine protease